MSVLDIIWALLFGFGFGWLLQRAGLTRYEKIANAFRFTDQTVLKFMLSALASGMIFVRIFTDLNWMDPALINPTYVVGNLVGGLIFGVGMAAAGLCPGTTVAGVGRGNLDYLIPGFLGFITGGVIFGVTYPSFFPQISAELKLGNITIPAALEVKPWLFTVFAVLLLALLLYLVEKLDLRRTDKIKGEPPKTRMSAPQGVKAISTASH
jgi:hypothetical protein